MKARILLALTALTVLASGCRRIEDPVRPCDCDKNDSLSVPDQGLVAYYPFDGSAKDMSGNNYHGVVSGAVPAKDRFGADNHAYSFDGLNDFVGVYNLSGSKLEPKNGITISCFILPKSSSGREPWSRIIRKAADFQNGYILGWDHESNRSLQSILLYNCDPSRYYTPGDKIYFSNSELVGEWHHIAMTYSLDTKVSILYVDGIPVEKLSNCGYTFQHSSDKMGIGGSAGNITSDGLTRHESFPGSIDDVRIYDRALSSNEIGALFHEKGYKK